MAPSPPKTDQALALVAAGKLAQARSLITRAIQSSPADPAPVDAMRALCIAEGNLKQAHYFATRALALAPHNPTCLANLAALDEAKACIDPFLKHEQVLPFVAPIEVVSDR